MSGSGSTGMSNSKKPPAGNCRGLIVDQRWGFFSDWS